MAILKGTEVTQMLMGAGRWFVVFRLRSCPKNCLRIIFPSQFLEENNDM